MSVEMITAGYRKDAKGNLVAESNIKDIDLIRDDVVKTIVADAKIERDRLQSFKRKAFAEISALVETSGENYHIKIGGKKGNITIYSFDGKYKIQRSISEHLQFDEGIQAAKALINACLEDWTQDANANVKVLVQRAFDTDKDGNLSASKILGLRRVKIEDERWKKAMDAISDSIQIIGSKSYIRIYERTENGRYEPISLDIAGV